ncbi:MAG TPA: glycoside hydrolase family 25 protein [Flavobacterium sp.]|jgi:lysozyme
MKKRSPGKIMNRKPRTKKVRFIDRRAASMLFAAFILLLVFAAGYHYRDALAYYFSFKTDKMDEEDKLHALRNFQVMKSHPDHVFGFDVSEYQGDIDWEQTDSVDDAFPLKFVFIRATAGKDAVDKRFIENWIGSKKANIVHGAYHYYRPNENSLEQAENFIKTVKLFKGDLPPVLDIEKLPEEQSLDSLKLGLKRWLNRVEKHYKVKPIIYSGERYYEDFLKNEFSEYEFWIANYNFFVEEIEDDWLMWQFTEKSRVPGIEGDVDINILNGSEVLLRQITRK